MKAMTKQKKSTESLHRRIAWPRIHLNLPRSKEIQSC